MGQCGLVRRCVVLLLIQGRSLDIIEHLWRDSRRTDGLGGMFCCRARDWFRSNALLTSCVSLPAQLL
jgi:hypothetical protein